jgi:O-antigen/teichoic acid export membrane protein
MKALAFITGSACLILFTVTIVVMLLIDMPITETLEIEGVGLLLMALPIIGMGLVIASYEVDTIRIERKNDD